MAVLSIVRVKEALHIDSSDDDQALVFLIEAAEGWLKSVGVAEEDLSHPSVKQAAVLMVKFWFDTGTAIAPDSAGPAIPPAVLALIAPWRKVLI
jgi:hypothetical protein